VAGADADRDAAEAAGVPAADVPSVDLPAADDGPSGPPDGVEAELDDVRGAEAGAGAELGVGAGRLGVLRGTTATRRCAWVLRCTGELV